MKNAIPPFTQVNPGEAAENQRDAQQIIKDQDITQDQADPSALDEELGAKSYSLDESEEGPSDFLRGEVDVKTQMDRAAREIHANVTGHHNS